MHGASSREGQLWYLLLPKTLQLGGLVVLQQTLSPATDPASVVDICLYLSPKTCSYARPQVLWQNSENPKVNVSMMSALDTSEDPLHCAPVRDTREVSTLLS